MTALANTTPTLPTTTNNIDNVVVVPEKKLWRLKKTFDKLARRAKKLGFQAPAWVEVSREEKKFYLSEVYPHIDSINDLGEDQKIGVMMVTIRVIGERPHIPGWTMLGAVQHHGAAGNILAAAPSQVIPESFRTAKPLCTHCKTTRARKDTYILKNVESGEVVQIGRNCLQDFLGEATDAKLIATMFTSLQEACAAMYDIDGDGDDGEYAQGPGKSRSDDLLEYLAVVAATCRLDGWVSKGTASETDESPTAHVAESTLGAFYAAPPEGREPLFSSSDLRLAVKALEWVRSIPEDDRWGYIGNLFTACFYDDYEIRNMGLAASLVGAAYPRAMRKIADAEAAKAASLLKVTVEPKYLEIKSKIKGIEMTVTSQKPYTNDFGTTTYLNFESEGGKFLFFWKASGAHDLNVGDKVTFLSGTVKDQEIYKGKKRNVIWRGGYSVLEDTAAA